jgi:putative ABC transport system permease protein
VVTPRRTRALDRKLLRDLRRYWGQVVSIAMLVACGVMTVVAMRSTLESVRSARDAYYVHYRFADVFASVTRAPEPLARTIAMIPGVGDVQTRVTVSAILDVPGLREPATGQLLSIPSERRPMTNDVYIARGRYVAPDRNDEVLVSKRFADENALQPGDSLGAIINGRWQRLHIAGIGMSPEFVVETSGAAFIVDSRRFGILWMRREALAAATDMTGAFNGLAIALAPHASEPAVIAALDRLLAPYGSAGAIGRADQASNQVLDGEFQQLRAIGRVFPLFFLCIAAFLLNAVLSRLISTQRAEIGALKALGYSNRTVGAHYLGFGIAAVALGAVLGIVGGMWMGATYTGLYSRYFGFPALIHHTYWPAAVVAIAVSGGSALLGAAWAVRSATSLPPAQAFRPPAPERYRPLILERLGLAGRISPAVRMVLRNLERRPFRTAASVLGISFAAAVLVAGLYPFDGVDRLIDVQFRRAQRDDLSVAFSKPRPGRVRGELAAMRGVTRVELFRATPIRVRHAQRARTVSLLGIESAGTLRRLVDVDGASHAVPTGGIVLTTALARALGVELGGVADIELLERGGEARAVAVTGLLDEPAGFGAYMDRTALNRLLREGDVASGAYVSVPSGESSPVFDRLKRLPFVAGSSSRAAVLDYFERTIAESILISGGIVVFAAIVIAVGVVYNGARVALSERSRELASLRVLGFTRREVSGLFLGEQGAITAVGLPFGAVIGLGFAAILARAFATERARFPVVIERGTYAFAIAVVVLAATVVALVVRKRIDRLDLIATLKTGE